MRSKSKLFRAAFVLARYGQAIIGGAETLANGLAHQAQEQGWEVEVWTTCATDYTTWANRLSPGTAVEQGILVRRFPVDDWDPATFHYLNRQLGLRCALPVERQYDWLAAGPHSGALLDHVARHAADFDALIMMPYLHSITYDAAWLAGDRLVLWPCLHDERYAYMEPFRLLMESAWGVAFISPEEAQLALQGLRFHVERKAVIGCGVRVAAPPVVAQAEDEEEPYLLYLGRLEEGKNVPLLYEYMARHALEGGNLRLIIAGDGPCKPPQDAVFDYRGQVDEEEKQRLLAGALALCLPSYNESFSLVLMESWLAGRPALVWADCAVTSGHVRRSDGGLSFAGYLSFKDAVDALLENPQRAMEMGSNGRSYVLANYQWPDVFARFAETLAAWEGQGSP